MDLIGVYSFSIASALICVCCLFYTVVMNNNARHRARSRVFIGMVIVLFLGCLIAFFENVFRYSSLPVDIRRNLCYIFRMLYFLAHLNFIALFCAYAIDVCDFFRTLSLRQIHLFFTPFFILELVVLSNPITKVIFTLDEDLTYVRGIGVYAGYGFGILYFAVSAIFLVRFYDSLTKLQKAGFVYFMLFISSLSFAQVIWPISNSELLGEAIGVMGLMIMIERDDYALDYKSIAYNREAFIHDLKTYYNYNRAFYVISVIISNEDIYKRALGQSGFEEIMREIAEFLRDVGGKYEIYMTNDSSYYMICPDISAGRADEMVESIRSRFEKEFGSSNNSTNIDSTILKIRCPDEIQNPNDILLICESMHEENEKAVLESGDLDRLIRRIDVEKAIVRGIEGDSFKVMYRPIYEKKYGRIRAAEALFVLKDSDLGEVEFSEYWSVAQESGFISELQYRMVESVIRFINTGVEHSGMEAEGIIIHILSIQVLTRELIEKVWEMVDSLQISPSLVIFDISDTIAVQAQDVLLQIIDEFSDMGIKFGLVNNDSGLFGLQHSVIDKFNCVTINVERHFASTDIEQSEMIIRNRIAMIRQLGKQICLSEVNTEELYEKVRGLDADFIVGDYLSYKVTGNELQNKFWNNEIFDETAGKEL